MGKGKRGEFKGDLKKTQLIQEKATIAVGLLACCISILPFFPGGDGPKATELNSDLYEFFHPINLAEASALFKEVQT